jgi:integrase
MGLRTTWNLPVEKIPTREEVRRVLEAAKKANQTDYVFFAVAANAALRASEIAHLRADGFQKGQLKVVRRKKAAPRPEWIDLAPDVEKLVAALVKERESGWLFPGESGPCRRVRASGEVEALCQGGHVSTREMRRRWREYATAAKIAMPGRGVHSLRHYGGTEFYAATRDLRATQIFLGHSSSTVTEVYAHVVDMRDQIRKMRPTL